MKKSLLLKGAVLSLIIVIMFTGYVFAEQTNDELILELKDEIIRIQNQGELGIRNANLCRSIVTLGAYAPLEEAKIEVGKEYYIYYEPANVFTKVDQGRYEFWFAQDIFLLDNKGEVVAERLDAVSVHFNTASPLLDLWVKNDLVLTAAPPGKYTYKIVLHDLFRDESVLKTIDFEVIE